MTSWADELDEEEKQQPQRESNAWKKGNPWGIGAQKKEESAQKSAHVDDSDFPLPGKEKAPRDQPTSNGRPTDERRVEERRDDRRDDYRRNERRDDYRREERRDERDDRPPRDDYRRDRAPRERREREFYGHDDREGRDERRSSDRDDERGFGRRGGFGKGFNRREREPRESKPREPIPFPTQAPFTAFVGNLPFSVGPDDLHQFFSAESCKVAHIRIIADGSGKPKGYGYVEFEDLESLKAAVGLDGQSLFDRQLKIDVAEAKPKQEDRPWKKRDSSPPRESSSPSSEAPKERPKLVLQSRTEAPKAAAPSDAYKSAKSNPFGEAKPRDENEILKKKEEERKQRETSAPKSDEQKSESEEATSPKKTEEKRDEERKPREDSFRTASRPNDRGPRRDDERGPRRDDNRGPRRDDERGPRGPRRDDERGPRRDDNRGPRRDDRGPRRDDNRRDDRGPRRDDKPRNNQASNNSTSVPAAKRAPWAPKQDEPKEVQSANIFGLLQEEDL